MWAKKLIRCVDVISGGVDGGWLRHLNLFWVWIVITYSLNIFLFWLRLLYIFDFQIEGVDIFCWILRFFLDLVRLVFNCWFFLNYLVRIFISLTRFLFHIFIWLLNHLLFIFISIINFLQPLAFMTIRLHRAHRQPPHDRAFPLWLQYWILFIFY